MGWKLEERVTKKVEIDPNLIQDGDFFAVFRMDGSDSLIMYGCGSHSGHSVMALRFDGELYIVESQSSAYWPVHGLQRTKWADWMHYAENADFHVAWLPLRKEMREKFDSKAAQDFFFATEGLPYGTHNFLFGWIDTPRSNLPGLLPNEFMPILFSMYEIYNPKGAYLIYGSALNMRLGTQNLTIRELAAEAA